MRHLTNEPPRDHPQAYLLAGARQIRDLSMVSAMDSARSRPAQGALGPTAKIIESDESLTLSITNPLGTSDEIRIPARMALIPSFGEPQARPKNSSNVSQSVNKRPGVTPPPAGRSIA
jgi:hypothetical protein